MCISTANPGYFLAVPCLYLKFPAALTPNLRVSSFRPRCLHKLVIEVRTFKMDKRMGLSLNLNDVQRQQPEQ